MILSGEGVVGLVVARRRRRTASSRGAGEGFHKDVVARFECERCFGVLGIEPKGFGQACASFLSRAASTSGSASGTLSVALLALPWGSEVADIEAFVAEALCVEKQVLLDLLSNITAAAGTEAVGSDLISAFGDLRAEVGVSEI